MRELHAADVPVVAEDVLRGNITVERFGIRRFESGEELRLRIEEQRECVTVLRCRRRVLRHLPVEGAIVGGHVTRRTGRVEQDAGDVAMKRHLGRVLRAPREQTGRRGCNHRPHVDVLDADGFSAARGEHLVPVLHESAFVDHIVDRRAAAGRIHDLDDVLERAGIFGIGHMPLLLQASARAGAVFHGDRLNGLELVAAHGRDCVLDQGFSRRRR